jgi:hypothetical protein
LIRPGWLINVHSLSLILHNLVLNGRRFVCWAGLWTNNEHQNGDMKQDPSGADLSQMLPQCVLIDLCNVHKQLTLVGSSRLLAVSSWGGTKTDSSSWLAKPPWRLRRGIRMGLGQLRATMPEYGLLLLLLVLAAETSMPLVLLDWTRAGLLSRIGPGQQTAAQQCTLMLDPSRLLHACTKAQSNFYLPSVLWHSN